MFIIIGIIISITILTVTLIFLRNYYNKKKEIFEKSKKGDEKLKNIDFSQNEDYFKKQKNQ